MDINYITISQLNRYIKIKLENDPKLQKIYLKAEISNYKHHTRGHLYFTLKDEETRVNAVMFASQASKLAFLPEDGMSVLIEGRIGVYEPNGGYQVYIDKMQQDGIGNLHIEFEKLKNKLKVEGLFDDKYKKQIPKFPKKIGIITASTGAAIKDILSTIKRRYPIAETILFPSLVQGDGAKENIVKQIEVAQNFELDVIICGRGGGSIEDLWAFNEEIVARAIFDSAVPIISAVGHEVDFTIADFVADLRAPTPTGAAEMAVPNMMDIINITNQFKIRLNESISNKIKHLKNRLKSTIDSYILKNPLTLYEVKEQRLDNIIDTLNNYILNLINNYQNKLKIISESNVLKNPLANYELKNQELNNLIEILSINVKNNIAIKTHHQELLIQKLELLNPLNILNKGYSVVKKSNLVIKNVQDVKTGDTINIRLYKGEIEAKVMKGMVKNASN